MQKIISCIFIFFIVVVGQASATSLYTPVRISGNIEWKTSYPLGFLFSTGTIVNGENFTIIDKYNTSTYANGIAYFNNDNDGLYVHFDVKHKANSGFYQGMNMPYIGFGDKNGENVYSIDRIENITQINKIPTDSGVKLYMIQAVQNNLKNDVEFMLLGKQNDGKFVRYFLMSDVLKNYVGVRAAEHIYIKRWRVIGSDSIEIEYDTAISYQNFRNAGKFVFKWDNSANWFSVKHVVY